MPALYGKFFDPKRFAAPYERPEEHLLDLVRWCELLLSAYLPRYAPDIRWAGETDLAAAGEDLRREVLLDFDKARFHIDARARASGERGDFLAGQYVREAMKLTNLELFALVLWLMPHYDERFGPLLGRLQNNPTLRRPGFDLALKLFHFVDAAEDVPGYHRQRRALEEKAYFTFLQSDGSLDERVRDFLLQNGTTSLGRAVAETYLPQDGGPLPLGEQEAEDLAAVISADGAGQDTLYVCLRGQKGVGRTTRVRRVADLLEVPAVLFSCAAAATSRRETFFSALRTAGRETILIQGLLVLKQFECLTEEPETAREVLDLAGQYAGVVFVLAEEETVTVDLRAQRRWVETSIPLPDKEASIALWQRALAAMPLKEAVDGAEMANKFTFTPAQIAGTGQTAAGMALLEGPLTRRQVTQAAYGQITHKLGEHATLIYARHTWDQLVLGETEKEMLQMACDQVRYQHLVYDQWGFNQRLAYGKGVSMLFAGPPGTGKTMAAQVVAGELGIEMYKVDLSQVVSKYIGETEKNLNQVFTEAKKSNVILFFDETDAILGKRTEVKDSHDKNANLETAYLLQKMEEYDGITVMTTNYKENIDSAFFRRISYVIHFAFPDEKARKEIWKGIFPADTPLGADVDFEYLAKQFEITGGSIKNIALVAAFMAARGGEKVGMRHIVRAVKYEMAKQGKIMLREDYGEYGYLLK